MEILIQEQEQNPLIHDVQMGPRAGIFLISCVFPSSPQAFYTYELKRKAIQFNLEGWHWYYLEKVAKLS